MTKFLENRKAVRKITKPIMVFYHGDCTDGFTAAWVAWKKFGNTAQYFPILHDDKLPVELVSKEIYTLDITFSESDIRKLAKINRRITAIDHHITSKSRTLMTYKPLYALHHSGCVLAWKYFFPNKPVPSFLLAIEDTDIWQLKIPGSLDLDTYLSLFERDFKMWSKLVVDFENQKKRKQILKAGQLLAEHENKKIQKQVEENASLVKFDGHTVYATNSFGLNKSKLGEQLIALKPPFAIIWYQNKDKNIKVSLRGRGNIDVAKIAEKYNGGGHKFAAAFQLKSLKDIPWKNTK